MPKLPEKTRSSATAEIARVVPHKPLPITIDFVGYIFVANRMGRASVN